MLRVINIKMPLKHTEKSLKEVVAKFLSLDEPKFKSFEISRKGIDARNKNNIVYVPFKWNRGEKSDRLSSGNREDVCPAAGILCDHGACGCRYLLWADADSAERISRQCGCTAAFGGNRRTDVFCGGVKAWRHVEKRTARNSRRQYDCEICGKIAFAEELGRKFVIEL